jgi:4-hydroxybenzoate decarboxylase
MRGYIEALTAAGGVRVVEREVSGRFELAAVTQAAQRAGDSPVLFRRVAGSAMPVITNVYGSRPRLMHMIGAGRSFCRRWVELMDRPSIPPVVVDGPALVEHRLSDLPQIIYFERDAGPYLTAGVYLANDPDTGVSNLSFHRAQIIDDSELRIRLGTSHDLTDYQRRAEARNEALECAILLGAPPPFLLAAAAPLRVDENEVEVAGKIAGAPIAMRRCRTVALEVPAETEIVIEGRILPHLRRPEGPFGEFMGMYVPVDDNHVFEVTAVVARKDALYQALICGSPEDLRLLELAVATQTYKALISAKLRGIIDVACVPFATNTVVQMEQLHEGHAKQVLMTAIGANHDWNKVVCAVDDDVDLNDFNDVWWAFLTRGNVQDRATVLSGLPGFYRDVKKDHWGRLAIDATVPFGRRDEFLRKRIPGAEAIRLADYLA